MPPEKTSRDRFAQSPAHARRLKTGGYRGGFRVGKVVDGSLFFDDVNSVAEFL